MRALVLIALLFTLTACTVDGLSEPYSQTSAVTQERGGNDDDGDDDSGGDDM